MFRFHSTFVAVGSLLSIAATAQLYNVDQVRWQPVADEVFLQEVGSRISTEKPITDLAALNGRIYAAIDGEVNQLAGDTLREDVNAPDKVSRIWALDGALWAAASQGLHRKADEGEWTRVDEREFVDLCMHLGEVHAATSEDIYRFENGRFVPIKPADGYKTTNTTYIKEDGTQVLPTPVRWGRIQRIASYSGTLYALRPGSLALLDGDVINSDFVDWGQMPSPNTSDLLAAGSRLLVGTDRGLGVLRGAALTKIDGGAGLPVEEVTCLASGFDGDVWVGTSRGAIRQTGDEFHYFGAQLWLPGDHVYDIAADGHDVYIATDAGLGIIRYEPYTLRKKADHYEQWLEHWGQKRLGFIHKLYWGGDEKGWIREISDNDGGHTSDYLVAMSYKYAVTGDPNDRAEAVDAFEAMVWLEEITPVDGFFARSIWGPGDEDTRSDTGSGGIPAKWYETEDGWWWKGDTSSDEVSAHFFSVALFHDLVAEGAEKDRAAEHLGKIASHIIDNGWVLRDMDGGPTRWGRWDPEYLLRPYGFGARGLNGMEAQAYVITAGALTGNDKYDAALQQLLDWGYHKYTVRQKLTFPPEDVVPWDDRLAFMCYHPMMRYVDDPHLRSIYLRSLERSWEVQRMQHVAFYNFTYGAITGNDCEVDRAVQYLREWPLDCVSYSYANSHRRDLDPEPGYVPYGGGTRAMSAREVAVKRGSRSMLDYDGGGGGRSVDEPTGFLMDYWMGRYHGFITAPKSDDPALVKATWTGGDNVGAKPYSGPPRPVIQY